MPIANDGVMIILSSPSGAGKTTLVSLLSKIDNFEIQFHTQQDNQDLTKLIKRIIFL